MVRRVDWFTYSLQTTHNHDQLAVHDQLQCKTLHTYAILVLFIQSAAKVITQVIVVGTTRVARAFADAYRRVAAGNLLHSLQHI